MDIGKKESIVVKKEVDLETALSIAGTGCYNIKYCVVLALFLIGFLTEVVGYSYILPAAKCDLKMTDLHRGLIASIPYIAVILTSYPWGYLVDTRGRRPILLLSTLCAGVFGMLAAFMPDIITFAVCKFVASLCVAVAGSTPYTYIGEMLPRRHRDIALSILNAMQTLGSALVPLLAWAILPTDFTLNLGVYDFRPWRLLVLAYSSIFIICVILLYFAPESPKYLVSEGKHEEALKVLQNMFAGNKSKSPNEYPVSRITDISTKPKTLNEKTFITSIKEQTLPLLRPPYLKWLCLNGFLLFGIFSSLNGLYVWVPDVLNTVITGGTKGGVTACQIIRLRLNKTTSEETECDDLISITTFAVNAMANCTCALLALLASLMVKLVGKKKLLILIYLVIGISCISTNIVRNEIIFAIILSSLQLTAVGIGPINAYGVQIFPTHLRGMAISLSIMLGRTGSILGINIAGLLLNTACEATFYSFGGLLLICCGLTFLLP